jgi:hypothetical protein
MLELVALEVLELLRDFLDLISLFFCLTCSY